MSTSSYAIVRQQVEKKNAHAPFALRITWQRVHSASDMPLDKVGGAVNHFTFMSVLFFKRFLQRPFQVASIIPSSRAMVERVASKMDFTEARVIAEYGPGEGVHSREIARRMSADSTLLLFELDPDFSRDLERQFSDDARVHVINGDAARLPEELAERGIAQCDYIISGIPFSILDIKKKRALLRKTYEAVMPGGDFIIYQVTNELRQHATLFQKATSEYFLQNIPPMFITVFHKTSLANQRNGRAHAAMATAQVAVNHSA
ncbi:MAG: methyltransferase domain-containing protein [Verrucomicrobiota bacterium]|nr:methyltransferase domain-containing protein [Verrucomicrobiota bacterium]